MAAVYSTDPALYWRLLRQARSYWLHITGLFLLSLLSTPMALLTPLPLKIAVDSVIGSHPLPGLLEKLVPTALTRSDTTILLLAAGLLIALAMLGQVQGFASSLLRTYTGERLVLDFQSQLFGHSQRLSLSYHDSKGVFDAVYRIQHDASAVQSVALNGLIPFITSACTLISMLYIVLRLDWQLGLIALAVSPSFFVLSRVYRKRLRSQSREVKRLESSALSIIQEVLGALRVVKAFGREEHEQQRFIRRSRESFRSRLQLDVVEGRFGLLINLATAIGTAAVLFIGMRHVQSGALTMGDLLLVMGYIAQLYGPLKTISKKATSLQSSFASAERAFALLDEAPDVPERPHARPLARATGDVAFRNVSFAYHHAQPVLHDISFEITPGTCVGIAGTTGAGKTTLMSLLVRFYDPTEGQILLDGIDLCDYKLADLRNQFAIVLQEPVLFSTSIGENIAYARPRASEREIIAAAKAANAHDFILSLPEGYQTLVGERGMRLSGGERQRISLARAFLKDAPILILDEPTSSVDLKTEAVIMEAMERLMRGRTTFMIAHRLSTLERCELRLRLERGRLIEVTPAVALAALGKPVALLQAAR